MIFLLKNSRTPGTLVHGPHGNQPNNSSPTITRVTSGIEYSRPFRPKWSGTAGLIFQDLVSYQKLHRLLLLTESFPSYVGKIVNIRRLDEVINSINGWYMERGLFGLVSGVEILSGGILRLQVSEAEVNNISIRFLNKTGEPTTGKTRPETILRQLNTKKGQVYSMLQAKRDVDTLLAMGIMEDVSIVPQPAGDSGKVDLTINAVERVSGGISAGGGISSGYVISLLVHVVY
ncbi:putative POTRA domain, surface antigen D15 [Helianthus anomalus]